MQTSRVPCLKQDDTLEVMAIETDTVILRIRGEMYRARALPDADHAGDPLSPGDRVVVTNDPAEWGLTLTERITGPGDPRVRDGCRYGLEGFQYLPESEWGPSER
jgi:hypothetical protein